MRWLIDGYNVIRRDAELRDREQASLAAGRTALLALVGRAASRVSDNFTIVFDGAQRGGGEAAPRPGRVEVVFSRPPESADDTLRRLAATLREGAIVVSSDRAVQDAARRAHAVAVSAEQFVDAIDGPTVDELDDDDGDERPDARRGPSRRPSREARDVARVLRRLRER
ncbi:MAG TPA: NYN domain-containing protein [Methylomirabilota bacterium]|jgi:predicted RNA-binding protein with PIN domain|nr:NYN domain-containing protein [Methylomirabilota bacterium]